MGGKLDGGRQLGRAVSPLRRLAGLSLALSIVAAFPSAAAALLLERSPYLQMGTETSMVVRWRTDTASESRLRFGPAPDQLDAWAQTIREQPWEEVHVFFKHEDEGAGPRVAEKFEKLF